MTALFWKLRSNVAFVGVRTVEEINGWLVIYNISSVL
jgi:hypothetical protein